MSPAALLRTLAPLVCLATWTYRPGFSLEASVEKRGEEFTDNGIHKCIREVEKGVSHTFGSESVRRNDETIQSICLPKRPKFISPMTLAGDPELDGNVTLKFIHIPKVAGSTIELLGREHGYSWGINDKSGLIKHLNHPQCWGSQYYHGIPSGVRDPSVKTFCVVRDPYARAVSEIRFEQTFYVKNITCPTPRMLNQLIMEQMNKTIQKRNFPCHWIAQYKYMAACDHVLRMKYLSQDLEALSDHYNADFKLGEEHAMDDKAKLGDECILTKDMLEEETMEALRKEYHIDAELNTMLDGNVIGNKDRLDLANRVAELELLDREA